MESIVVIDWDTLFHADDAISHMQLLSDKYKSQAKASSDNKHSILFAAILQFCAENTALEYIIYFRANVQFVSDLQFNWKKEINQTKNVLIVVGNCQLWCFLGTKISTACRVRFITNEKAIVNEQMKAFIDKIASKFNKNKAYVSICRSPYLNLQNINYEYQKGIKATKYLNELEMASKNKKEKNKIDFDTRKDNEETKDIQQFNKVELKALNLNASQNTQSNDAISTSQIKEELKIVLDSSDICNETTSSESNKFTKYINPLRKDLTDAIDFEELKELQDYLFTKKDKINEIVSKCLRHFEPYKQVDSNSTKTKHNIKNQNSEEILNDKQTIIDSKMLTSILAKTLTQTNTNKGDHNTTTNSQFCTINLIENPTATKIDCKKLQSYLEANKVIKTSNKAKSKELNQLDGNLTNYINVCMYIIEIGVECNFFRAKSNLTTEEKLKNIIADKLEDYKNFNHRTDTTQHFISENKDLKDFVFHILKKLKLISSIENKIIYNDYEITNIKIDFLSEQEILIKMVEDKVKKVLEGSQSQNQ